MDYAQCRHCTALCRAGDARGHMRSSSERHVWECGAQTVPDTLMDLKLPPATPLELSSLMDD